MKYRTRSANWFIFGVLATTYVSMEAQATLEPLVIEDFKLLASGGSSEDHFGGTVAISGETAIVGMSLDDDNGIDSGSAYIYRFDGSDWIEEAKLVPSDGAAGNRFGISASIRNGLAIIGSDYDSVNGTNSGSAYIFRFDGNSWQEEAKLVPSDGESGEQFGISVAIDGDHAVVGAYRDDDQGVNSGSTYAFRFDGTLWGSEEKIIPSDVTTEEYFGISTAIYSNRIIVGSLADSDNGPLSGSAYIFSYTGSEWKKEHKLLASDGAPTDFFGFSVSIDENIAVVGAYGNSDYASDCGSAYVFRHHNAIGWQEETKLLASKPSFESWFGFSVSVSGDAVVVGADGDSGNGYRAGAAYLYRFDGDSWTAESKLHASDGSEEDYFGSDVSISGDMIIVSSFLDDDNGLDSGSAYLFDIGIECLPDITGDGMINVTDLLAVIDQWGLVGSPADINEDGIVNVTDLLMVVGNWGPCE